MKTLVWITHSFRSDSRLMNSLNGDCTFVYYSPYYFAGPREKAILNNCSHDNLDLFYGSIQYFQKQLDQIGCKLNVFKEKDPISHINMLIEAYGFDTIVIDQPLFAMWETISINDLSIKPTIIDSDLINIECGYKTAKHRWMYHVKQDWSYYTHHNLNINHFDIGECGQSSYPIGKEIDVQRILNRAYEIASDYINTRDKHNGQTELSTLFQNGLIDPHNIFYAIMSIFEKQGADLSKNEGAHAAMLRQFTFRELCIMQSRQLGLTMEHGPQQWLSKTITEKSYNNLISKINEESTLTWDQIKTATTNDEDINQILSESYSKGVMPNRARMYYAGWLFYNAPTGLEGFNMLLNTFDLLLNDGQCPTNYSQCCSCMNLQYGKVMLLNKNRVMNLLSY